MDFDEDKLKELEGYAAALMSISEIAILLDIPPSDRRKFETMCKQDTASSVYRSFHRGRLKTKLELRQNIIKLAKAGSPAAEPIAIKFIKEQLID